MRAEVCAFADLVDLNLICVVDSGGRAFPHDRYPRRTWWKFWEKPRTRDEYIKNEHEKHVESRECHSWKGKSFHFCVQAGQGGF